MTEHKTFSARMERAGFNKNGSMSVLIGMLIIVGVVLVGQTAWRARPIIYGWQSEIVSYDGTSVTLEVTGKYLRNDCEYIFGSSRGYIMVDGEKGFKTAKYELLTDPGMVGTPTIFKPPMFTEFRFGWRVWTNEREGGKPITHVMTTFDHICDAVVIQDSNGIQIIGGDPKTRTTTFGPRVVIE